MAKRKRISGSGEVISAMLAALVMMIVISACATKTGPGMNSDAPPATVTSVNVEPGEDETLVVITTDPDLVPYSVYKWIDPVRVVVDISGADPGQVPNMIPVANDLIQEIEVKALVPGQETTNPGVRVIINLNQNAEYQAQRTDGKLVISLQKELTPEENADLFQTNAGVVFVEGDDSGQGAAGDSDEWVWLGPPAEAEENAALPEIGPAPAVADGIRAPAAPFSPAKNLLGIKVENEGEMTRVFLSLDGAVGDYSAFTLEGPDRLVVDLWGLQYAAKTLKKNINEQGILRVRVGQHPDKLRLVFDASEGMPHFRFDKTKNELVVTFSKNLDVSASPGMSVAVATETAGSPNSQGGALLGTVPEPMPTVPEPAAAAKESEEWTVVAQGTISEPWTGPASAEETGPAPEPVEVPRSSDAVEFPSPSGLPPAAGAQEEGPYREYYIPEKGVVGIAYLDSVKFYYSEDSSRVVIHSDRVIRSDQWSQDNNYEEGVQPVVTIFLEDSQLAADQQMTFDTSEFRKQPNGCPIDLFSVYQSPGRPNQVALIIVLNDWAAGRWNQVSRELTFEFENYPGSLGLGGYPNSGVFSRRGEASTGGLEGGYGSPMMQAETSRYSGELITINVKNGDILDVLRMIAEPSGKNIIVSKEVKGTVTVMLADVPWDQALDVILDHEGLEMREDGDIIRIAKRGKFAKEEEDLYQRNEKKKKYEDMTIEVYRLNYIYARDMRQLIAPILTRGRGRVNADRRSNTMIVQDRPEVQEQVRDLIQKMDRPTKQVLIEARIVEANDSVTREIGVQWGTNMNLGPQTGTPTGVNFPNSIQVGGAVLGGVTNAASPASVGSISGQGGALGLTVGSLNNVIDLDVMLHALEAEKKVRIVSSPRIVTLTDESASIQQGVSIPYPPPAIIGSANQGWQFVEAALRLEVTPHVAEDSSITLEVVASNNTPYFFGGAQPGLIRKEARTTILLQNGETAVIGGVFKSQVEDFKQQPPYLGELPYIGKMFQVFSTSRNYEEMLIFLTPQIIESPASRDYAAGGIK